MLINKDNKMDTNRLGFLLKKFEDLMEVAEKNTAIMHEINESNPLKFIRDHLNGRWGKANKQSGDALKEGEYLLKEIYQIYHNNR
jgi:hypothetical protein